MKAPTFESAERAILERIRADEAALDFARGFQAGRRERATLAAADCETMRLACVRLLARHDAGDGSARVLDVEFLRGRAAGLVASPAVAEVSK